MNANLLFLGGTVQRESCRRWGGGPVPMVIEPTAPRAERPDSATGAGAAAARMEIARSDGSRVIVDREINSSALDPVLSVLARR